MSTSTSWQFAEPKSVAVFTTKQVMKRGGPILHVTHDAKDGAWQFLGSEGAVEENAMIVSLSEILEADQTVAQLSDLALGWEANRDSISSPWKRFRKVENEIFDIVNDRDEVIGQRTRGEVHRLGLKHRAVHVLVFNGKGELFLQKRSMQKDTFPGAWDSSCSGHLDSGEDYDACAVRELREELGFETPRAPERLFKIEACEGTGMEFVRVYRLEAEGPFTLHPQEIKTGGWFTPEAIRQWIKNRPQEFASALLLIFSRYFGESGQV